jgi:hypothetical protein
MVEQPPAGFGFLASRAAEIQRIAGALKVEPHVIEDAIAAGRAAVRRTHWLKPAEAAKYFEIPAEILQRH